MATLTLVNSDRTTAPIKQTPRRPVVSRLARKLTRLEAMDPAITSVIEKIIDDAIARRTTCSRGA